GLKETRTPPGALRVAIPGPGPGPTHAGLHAPYLRLRQRPRARPQARLLRPRGPAAPARRLQEGLEEGRLRDARPRQPLGLPRSVRARPDRRDLPPGDLVRPRDGRGRAPDRREDPRPGGDPQ